MPINDREVEESIRPNFVALLFLIFAIRLEGFLLGEKIYLL